MGTCSSDKASLNTLSCVLTSSKLVQTRLEMQKALEEDSSVYEYDNVYDDIQKQRLESNKKLLSGTDRKVCIITIVQSVFNI